MSLFRLLTIAPMLAGCSLVPELPIAIQVERGPSSVTVDATGWPLGQTMGYVCPADPTGMDLRSPRLRRNLFDFGCTGMGSVEAGDRHILEHDFRGSADRVVADFERAPIWWVVLVEWTPDGSGRRTVQMIRGGDIEEPRL